MMKKKTFLRRSTLALTLLLALASCRDDDYGTDGTPNPDFTPGRLGIEQVSLDGGRNAARTRADNNNPGTRADATADPAPNTPITALTEGDEMTMYYSFTGQDPRGFNPNGTKKYIGRATATSGDDNALRWNMQQVGGPNPLRPNAPGNGAKDPGETWAGAQAMLLVCLQPENKPDENSPWGEMRKLVSTPSGMYYAESENAVTTIPGNTGGKKLRAYYDALTANTRASLAGNAADAGNTRTGAALTPGLATLDRAQDSPRLGAIRACLAHTGALLNLRRTDITTPGADDVFVKDGRAYRYSDFTALWAEVTVTTVATTEAVDGSGGSTGTTGNIETYEVNETFYVLLTPAATTTGADATGTPTAAWQAIVPGSVRTGITDAADADPVRTPGRSLVSISTTVTGFAARISATPTDGGTGTVPLNFVLKMKDTGSKSLDANLRYDLRLNLSPKQSTVSFATPGKPGWGTQNDEEELVNIEKHLSVAYDSGSGTYSYTVKSAKGLKAVADWMNGGGIPPLKPSDPGTNAPDYSGNDATASTTDIAARMKTHITLSSDLDFATQPVLDDKGSNWVPIGNNTNGKDYGYPYTGTFDGGGHTIKGLVCHTTGNVYSGFFARTDNGATVKNLTLEDAIISGDYICTGGIAGLANKSTVTNCHFRATPTDAAAGKGTVTGTSTSNCYTGGIVGQTSTNLIISGCTNSGTVTSTRSTSSCYTGGIVGISSNVTLIACTNSGTVTGAASGADTSTGGIVGWSDYNATVIACTNTSPAIRGSSDNAYTGGIVGWNKFTTPRIIACYTTTPTLPVMGAATDSAPDPDGCYPTGSGLFGTSGSATDGAAPSSITDLNQNYVTTMNLAIYTYHTDETTDAAKQCNYHFKASANADAATLPPTLKAGAPRLSDFDLSLFNPLDFGVTISGKGSNDADIWNISTPIGLDLFSATVNQGGDNLKLNAILTENINLSNLPKDEKGNNWTPIGIDMDNYYTGTFDGGGHTVKGLYMNDEDKYIQGFFGRIGGHTTVQNLTVEGSVKGSSNVGGIVGVVSDYSRIENCTNRVKVEGNSNVGGVAGQNWAYSIIIHCINEGIVTGQDKVGGVAGTNNRSTIIACYNNAAVTGRDNVGGVMGLNSNSSNIVACYNIKKVTGRDNVGGVAGKNDEKSNITACYNTGATQGSSNIGQLMGKNGSDCTITKCYYLKDTSPVGSNDGGTVTCEGIESSGWNRENYLNDAIETWNAAHTSDGTSCPYQFSVKNGFFYQNEHVFELKNK